MFTVVLLGSQRSDLLERPVAVDTAFSVPDTETIEKALQLAAISDSVVKNLNDINGLAKEPGG